MRLWQLRNETWKLPAGGAIMGILNVTPDSFSDGGLHATLETALAHAHHMIEAGADIIDVGGESTRPGADPVSEDEERRRAIPVIRTLRREFPSLRISIDTRHFAIARAAWEAGADIVNDITGLADPAMRGFCAAHPCGIVLMHMKGEPRTMQDNPCYDDVVAEVRDYFSARVQAAQVAGVDPSRICLDPGIGFGKTVQHNLMLISHLDELRVRNLPMMMALSRKRFMGEILGNAELPKVSPVPTVAMSLLAADRGAEIHRVHDVVSLRQALALRLAAMHA